MSDRVRHRPTRALPILLLVAALALVVVIASRVGVVSYIAPGALPPIHVPLHPGGHLQPVCSPSAPSLCRQVGPSRSISGLAFWLGLALGLMLVVGSLALYLKTRGASSPADEELPVAATPPATPRAGSRPRNPREAVLAAFGELEDRLATAGVGRLPAEGADSYLRRALPTHWRTSSAKSTLVRWYAVARFSDHPIDSQTARQAVAAAAELARGTFGNQGEGADPPGAQGGG